ncbi:mitochondrial distribution and morphology protein 12 [Trichophyton interdigitale MR816]|uniref:Mitochondrial distribution and morphology protein 12 n=1 Tax=Trichophyton interdigitale (strain MR816) TaxID=1215338 RepID=A0A059J199_TRIIM|nr:mitochondrial distribution and morphology protein 12 [Trichophyton interdigitale H6]KDB21252.1 mitochondrial distribution and morphology protein 12 [Trichophyton interdigitale MR816]
MSIDINWEAATSGPDGEELAERIRCFIHDKFQQIALPRFIRSVEVNSFDFGTVSPQLQVRDICDPFNDFYEEDEDGADLSESSEGDEPVPSSMSLSQSTLKGDAGSPSSSNNDDGSGNSNGRSGYFQRRRGSREYSGEIPQPLMSPINLGESFNPYLFPRTGTPGIPGGTSHIGYYNMPRGGLSGTQTPLASVASVARGGPLSLAEGWPPPARQRESARSSDTDVDSPQSRSRPSTSSTRQVTPVEGGTPRDPAEIPESESIITGHLDSALPARRMREQKPDDFQVLCRLQYSGNMKLSITAQILLDYPMPSFVGLPLKLNITGFTFDGVAVVAYIRKRIHVCFLSPEDADTLLGADDKMTTSEDYHEHHGHHSHHSGSANTTGSRRSDESLLREIRVESEIGRKESGKQVLKNVGKVEKFVLEQVRRIFEEEFVYPSFWTFLV